MSIQCPIVVTVTNPLPGSLDVNTIPAGADISIDRVDQGRQTHAVITNLAPGYHTVRLNKAGYDEYTFGFTAVNGQTYIISVALTASTPICTPVWRCRSPLDGNKEDGCGNTQPDSSCNPPSVANVVATDYYYHDTGNKIQPDIPVGGSTWLFVRYTNTGGQATVAQMLPSITVDGAVLQNGAVPSGLAPGGIWDQAFLLSNLSSGPHTICANPLACWIVNVDYPANTNPAADGSTQSGTIVCYNPPYDPIKATCTITGWSAALNRYQVQKHSDGGIFYTSWYTLTLGACLI